MLTKEKFRDLYKATNKGSFGYWPQAYEAYCAATALDAANDFFAPTTKSTYDAVPCPKEEGNNPMIEKYRSDLNVAAAGMTINAEPEVNQFTIEEEQRKFIAREALRVIYDKSFALREKFKIDFNFRPKTVQEAYKRLKDGLWSMPDAAKKDDVKYPWGGLQETFSWRGPDDQADEIGYEIAKEAMDKFTNPLLMEIRVLPPERAMESFRKIEAYEV